MREGSHGAAALMGQLGQKLLLSGHINETQLEAAMERKRQTGGFLGEILIEMGFVQSRVIGRALEDAVNIPYADLAEVEIDPTAVDMVSEHYQRRHRVIPFKVEERQIHVAMTDPLNVMTIDDLHMMTGLKIVPYLALSMEIQDALNRVYSARSAAENVLKEIEQAETNKEEQELSVDQLVDMAEDAPII